MSRTPLRWLALLFVAVLVTGCSTKRDITFTAVPADADLTIDGVRVGKGPVTQEIVFKGAEDEHSFSASRKGFKDETVKVLRDHEKTAYQINLKPQTRRIVVDVTPPAVIRVDGKPISNQFESRLDRELEFRVDAQDKWVPVKITAERPNFENNHVDVSFEDPRTTHILRLPPKSKAITIDSNPPGADIWLDGKPLGKAPAVAADQKFPFDISSNLFEGKVVKAQKAGYDPIEKTIGWDDGQKEYTIDLLAKSKTIRLKTEPANCVVELDGTTKLPVDGNGIATAKLDFPPIDEQGTLKTYKITVSKKTADSEWYPQTITVGWENGRPDYTVVLKEILTRPVPLTTWEPTRGDDGWAFLPKTQQTLAYKDTTEGKMRSSPQQLTKMKGSQIDTLTVSPDGAQLLYTVLISGDKNDFRSQMMMVKTDGSAGSTYLSDGKSLDLTPSFTPDGQNIVFSSNRAGRKLSIWQMSAVGTPGKTQLTAGDNNDLWPVIDADPKPRLYYQTLLNMGPEPRLFVVPVGTTFRTELTEGAQPRVSPRADSVAFVGINARTQKRDIFIMSDKGNNIQNITNTPDVDDTDPAWNKDGSVIAFASNRGQDADKNFNYDIWTLEVGKSETPTQVTSNGSHDDCPNWDNNNNLYFRSNRGGDWNVWKISAK